MLVIDNENPIVKNFQYLELTSLLILSGYFLQLHKDSPVFLYTSFYQVYSFIGIATSLIIIGFGTPMLEIAQDGNSNGSFWVILIFLTLGLETGRLGFDYFSSASALNIRKINRHTTEIIVFSVSAVVLSIGIFILLKYGSPVILGVTRVAFWTNIVSGSLSLYPSLLGQTFFLCAFTYLNRRKRNEKNGKGLAIIVLYFLTTLFVAGEKFSTFIFYITAFFALSAGIYGGLTITKKIVFTAITALVVLLSITTLNYLATDKDAIFLAYRIAMQGQLLWSVLSENAHTLMFGYASHCYFGCNNYESGTDFISAKYLPSGLWDSYQETGSGLTGFMPALPILTFGMPITLLIHLIVSFLYGGLQRALVRMIENCDLIASFLLFKIYFGLLVFWYASKDSAIPGVLVTATVFFLWVLIFHVERLKSSKKHRPNNRDVKC
jgi:hypothetical protein